MRDIFISAHRMQIRVFIDFYRENPDVDFNAEMIAGDRHRTPQVLKKSARPGFRSFSRGIPEEHEKNIVPHMEYFRAIAPNRFFDDVRQGFERFIRDYAPEEFVDVPETGDVHEREGIGFFEFAGIVEELLELDSEIIAVRIFCDRIV